MKDSLSLRRKRGRIKTDVFEGTLDDLYNNYLHYRTLTELAGHITSDIPFETVLERILDDLNTYTGAERSLIMIFDREGQVAFQKGRNLDEDDIQEPSFEVSWSIINKVRQDRSPVCIKNAMEDKEFKTAGSVMRLQVLSVICAPILYKDQLTGVFYADNRNVLGIFTKDESTFVHQCLQFITTPLYTLFKTLELKNDLEHAQQQISNRDRYGDIIGHSPALLKILNLINQVAPTTATVLISGASGTGKELVARAIHRNSDRREKPFISLNCGALPENLFESELFGHVKGAFTGAHKDKKGWFETADGGTILFDEISEMTNAMQVKLLRVLQSGEYSPVGSNAIKHCDVRIIAATNVNLAHMVEQKTFRRDLFYRLNIVNIDLPKLCDRREDILLLAMSFLKKYGRPDLQLDPEAQKVLSAYDYPGNVRELENAMQRAAVLCKKKRVLVEHLPAEMQNYKILGKMGAFAIEKQKVVENFEETYIKALLQQTNGNVSQAAKRAGMDAKNLYQKMGKYRIDAEPYRKKRGKD